MARPGLMPPEAVLRLEPNEADELLDRLERDVPMHPALVELPEQGASEAIVFGDSHGDWRSTRAAEALSTADGGRRRLIGLGDYVDRSLEDCGEGSVANALYLLQLVAASPDRVLLIQGNHETTLRIPALPHDLPEQVDELWGPEVERYTRLIGLFERGPVAAVSASGVYLAHAGFPRAVSPSGWKELFDHIDDDRLAEIVWAECAASRNRRGATRPFDERDLTRFLDAAGLALFLRGHDPDLTGRPVYRGRCLTLHTTRLYERFGGVIVARLPLDRPVRGLGDLRVEHLATEGRTFPPPR